MSNDKSVSEILDLAADEIQRRGWTNGKCEFNDDPWGTDGKSPVCLEGAIGAALGLSSTTVISLCQSVNSSKAGDAVREYLGREELHPANRLYEWNDARGRTAQEVIEVLRATAAVERAKEESLEGSEVTK